MTVQDFRSRTHWFKFFAIAIALTLTSMAPAQTSKTGGIGLYSDGTLYLTVSALDSLELNTATSIGDVSLKMLFTSDYCDMTEPFGQVENIVSDSYVLLQTQSIPDSGHSQHSLDWQSVDELFTRMDDYVMDIESTSHRDIDDFASTYAFLESADRYRAAAILTPDIPTHFNQNKKRCCNKNVKTCCGTVRLSHDPANLVTADWLVFACPQ